MITAAIALDESWNASAAAKRLLRESYPHLSTANVFDRDDFCLLHSTSTIRQPLFRKDDGQRFAALCFMSLNPGKDDWEDGKGLLEDWTEPFQADGLWTAFQWDQSSRTLTIATDPLGMMKVYMATVPGGYLFSSDFGALARAADIALTVDPRSVVAGAALGYFLGDRSIMNEITLLPPGALIRLDPAGKTIKQDLLRYGDRYSGLPIAEKQRLLGERFGSLADRWLYPFAEESVLSISAGLDSRYALALLAEQGITIPMFTFGHPDSQEVMNARAVVARIGAQTTNFDAFPTHWDSWLDSVLVLGEVGLVQWRGWADEWLELLRTHGQVVVTGNFGDALSGKHLGLEEHAADQWLSAWIDMNTDDLAHVTPLLREPWASQVKEILAADMKGLADQAEYPLPHQLALHLDLYSRQRRLVSNQPNLIARYCAPCLYFYSHELIDFWTNVGWDDLVGQRLYRRYGAARYPELFQADARKGPSAPAWALQKLRSLGSRVLGRHPGQQPGVIDNSRLLHHNAAKIKALVEQDPGNIGSIVDLGKVRDEVSVYEQGTPQPQPRSQALIRVVSALMLASLASR